MSPSDGTQVPPQEVRPTSKGLPGYPPNDGRVCSQVRVRLHRPLRRAAAADPHTLHSASLQRDPRMAGCGPQGLLRMPGPPWVLFAPNLSSALRRQQDGGPGTARHPRESQDDREIPRAQDCGHSPNHRETPLNPTATLSVSSTALPLEMRRKSCGYSPPFPRGQWPLPTFSLSGAR